MNLKDYEIIASEEWNDPNGEVEWGIPEDEDFPTEWVTPQITFKE